MAVRIVCARADKAAANSLARYLKKQNVPANIGYASGAGQFANSANQIVLWSTHLSPYQKRIKDLPDSTLVLLDNAIIPPELSGLDFVNAKGIGSRESKSWRAVSQLVRRDVKNAYAGLAIDESALPTASNDKLDVQLKSETLPDVASVETELPNVLDELPKLEPSFPEPEDLDIPEVEELLETSDLSELPEDTVEEVQLAENIEEQSLSDTAELKAQKNEIPDDLPEAEELEVEGIVPDEIPLEEVEVLEEARLEEVVEDLSAIEEPQLNQQVEEVELATENIEIPTVEDEADEAKIAEDVLEDVPEFSELKAAQPTTIKIPKQKTYITPIVFLVVLMLGLGAAVGVLHPESPYYGMLSASNNTSE